MSDEEEKREYHGRAVVNGVPQFFSVSSLERADTRTGGCMRKWFYRYVSGIKDKESKSKTAGIALHKELARYGRTGDRMLSPLAIRGLFMVPTGEGLLIEQSIGGPKAPYLTADGVPLIGFVDSANDRCLNMGGSDIEDTNDPPNTIELIDWKWKGDGSKTEYYLEPNELIKTIQMAGYGLWAHKVFPDKQQVRLSHGYFPATRGQPRKVTKLHVIDECEKTWLHVDALARAIKDVAKETDVERVPGNKHGCNKYGGCQHREYCTEYKRAYTQDSLSSLFGETGANDIKGDMTMGLLTNLPPALQTQQAASQQQDVRAQLAQEETQQRTIAVQQTVGVLPGFKEAWDMIEAAGRGTPGLGGGAAQMRAALQGFAMTAGAGLAGSGALGQLMILDPTHVIQLASELRAAQPVVQQLQLQPAPVQHVQHNTMPAFLPPDAPASNPALAAKPIDATPGSAGGFLQQIAPQQMQQMAPAGNVVHSQPVAEAPKKRGRRTKAQIEADNAAAAQPATVFQQVQHAQPATVQQTAVTTDADCDLEVYVDCVPNGDYESLHPYIDQVCARLVQKFIPADGIRDVRCAPNDSLLGFGKWKGAIAAVVRECPPPDACYFLDTRNNEIAVEVADALRTVCELKNARYTKGIR